MNDKEISITFCEQLAERIVANLGAQYEIVLNAQEKKAIRDEIYRSAISARVREANASKP